MMRKISAYARKLSRSSVAAQVYNGGEWLNAISRCRQYGNSEIFAGCHSGTAENAQRAMLYARAAFQSIKTGKTSPDNTDDHDAMAHVVGISTIRAIEIAGQENNPMLDILNPARDAVVRMRERWEKIHQWGFDGPGLLAMSEALDVYEEILTNSSPAQMELAMQKRRAVLRKMGVKC